MEPDELYPLRNQFWLGNYKLALSEGGLINPTSEGLKIDRDVFLYRCHIALGNHSKPMKEIHEHSPTALLAVKLLASYLGDPGHKDTVIMTLKDWLQDPNSKDNNTLKLIGAIIFLNNGETKEALRVLSAGSTLEMIALKIQIYLKMQRLDLAKLELTRLQEKDDDSSLTQLATAWINLFLGKQKYQEAAYIYQELGEKSGYSSMLLNGLAVCYIRLEKYEEAMKCIQRAIKLEGSWEDLPKSQVAGELVVNLLVCASHLRKKTLVEECLLRLKGFSPQGFHEVLDNVTRSFPSS